MSCGNQVCRPIVRNPSRYPPSTAPLSVDIPPTTEAMKAISTGSSPMVGVVLRALPNPEERDDAGHQTADRKSSGDHHICRHAH